MISPFMEKINRKYLFVTASSMMALALSILASNMPNAQDIALINNHSGSADDPALPPPPPFHVQVTLPMAVFMFSLSYGAGFGPAMYTWSSELFPPRYTITQKK